MQRAKSTTARIVLLALVVLAATAIRLTWLDSAPLWWDEFVTLGRAKMSLADLWRSLSHQGPSDVSLDSSPPLLHIVIHYVLALGGTTDAWVKTPSVLFGVAGVLVLYPLGGRLLGGRSGLYAAALLGFSLFHIHYSREARPYALYIFLALASLWLLLRALEYNRSRDWVVYTLTAAAMLYSSYLGAASLAAQGGYVALLLINGRLGPGRLAPSGASLACAALAYVPWLPGHLFHMELIYSPTADMGLSWGFLARSIREFTAYGYQGDFPFSGLHSAVAMLGLATAFFRNRASALLLCLWMGLPLVAALFLKTEIAVNPRYLVNFVPGMALLAGAGLDGLTRALTLGLPGRASAVAALLAAVALCWPSLTALPGYYRRDQRPVSYDLLQLAEDKANIDTVAFVRNRHQKIFSNWYLPGVFGDFKTSADLGYRRYYLLAGADWLPDGGGAFRQLGGLKVRPGGMVNISPMPLTASYHEDFSTLSMYREAFAWDNAGPDLFQKSLSLYDADRPGRAIWRFVAPKAGFGQTLRLHCRFRLTKSRATPLPDASVTILAGDAPEAMAPLRTVTQADFQDADGWRGELAVSIDIPKPAGREFCLEFILEPGTIHGSLEPVFFRMENVENALQADSGSSGHPFAAQAHGPQAETSGIEVPAMLLAHLRTRTELAAWKPGMKRIGDKALYAFSLNEDIPGTHPAAQLHAFLAEHPGLEPIDVLRFPDGRAAVALFDPALTNPGLTGPAFSKAPSGKTSDTLSAQTAMNTTSAGPAPQTPDVPSQALFARGQRVEAMVLSGTDGPFSLSLGGTKLPMVLAIPPGAQLAFSPGGQGHLRLLPDYSQGQGPVFLNFGVVKDPAGECLTCQSENGCQMVYALDCGLPIRKLRVEYCPEAYGEPGQTNGVTLSWSGDGNSYHTLDSFTVKESELWEGKHHRIFTVDLRQPSTRVYLRLTLTGDKARIWAGPDTPMRIDAWLNAPDVVPLTLTENPFPVALPAGLHAFLSPRPLPDLDRLLAPH